MSEIELIKVPFSVGACYKGTELAPDKIVKNLLGNLSISEVKLLKTEENQLDAVVKIATKLRDKVVAVLGSSKIPIIIGGDPSISLGSIAASLDSKEDVGIIYIDAHGDCNAPEISPAESVHRMTLAATMGLGLDKLNSVTKTKLNPKNALFLGVKAFNKEEAILCEKHGVDSLKSSDLIKMDKHEISLYINNFIKEHKLKNIHLSIDPYFASGTSVLEQNGLNLEKYFDIVNLVLETNKVSCIDCMGFNPLLDKDDKTLDISVATILLLLSKLGAYSNQVKIASSKKRPNLVWLVKSVYKFISTYCKLKNSSNSSNEKLKDLQLKEFKKVVNNAWRTIPFYRIYWTKFGFHPSQLKSLDDINKIPCIDKNIVRENYNLMFNVKYNLKKLYLSQTGGTTGGMPMKFFVDNYFSRGKSIAFRYFYSSKLYNFYKWIDKNLLLRGFIVDPNLINKNIYWQNDKKHGGFALSSYYISNKTYSVYLNKMREFSPKVISAYPSAISAFCKLMQEHGDFGINGLKYVICSSENIYDWQRQLVRDTLGVEIYSYYGHSEDAVIAYQIDKEKMAFLPLYGYTEFLDENGNEVKEDGQIAEVVTTSFDNNYAPFIRYKTADVVEVSEYKQPGYTKIANKIIGRLSDFVYDIEGVPYIFTNSSKPLWDVDGIIAFQYEQNELGKLVLKLQVDSNFDCKNIEVILKRAKTIYFINFDMEINIVPKIEKTKAGKFRYLIQNLKK